MKIKQQRVLLAQDLYLNTDYTIEQIAEACGVAQRTISNWSSTGKWRELKGAQLSVQGNVVMSLYKRVLKMSEEDVESHTKYAREIAMVVGAIDKLTRNKPQLNHYISVFQQFNKYLIEEGLLELSKQFNIKQKEFINSKAKEL